MRLTLCVLISLCALPANGQETEKGPFVIELDDQQIEQLKNGYQLQSPFPPEIRDKITVIQVRYKPSPGTAVGNQGANASIQDSSGFNDPRSLRGSDSNARSLMNTPPPLYGPPLPKNWPNVASSNPPTTNAQGFSPSRQNNPASSVLTGNNNINSGYNGFQNSGLNPGSAQAQSNTGWPAADGSLSGNPSGQGNRGSASGLLPIAPNDPLNSGNTGWNRRGSNNAFNSSVPATGNQFNPGANANGSSNTLRPPQTNPTNYNFNGQPSNPAQPVPPQGNEFDTRYQRHNAAPQQWTDNQFRDPQFRAPATNQFAGQTNQQFAPTIPASVNDLSRRSSLMAGYHTPTLPNQMPATQNNLAGHRLAQRSANEFDGSNGTGNQLLAPPAIINGRPTGHRPEEADTSLQPPISSIDQANRFNGVLWFMLLCSFGLNIYLGWISRGFYVRYRELADELRETFSTVV